MAADVRSAVAPDPDVLGAPYTAETISLPDDEEGEVVATLVHRPSARPTTRAVLHVHGFADYFFQTAYAEWWTERGYDFYALDLRKYGRSIRPHQTPNYVGDLRDYFLELDEAWARGRTPTRRCVLSGHSTGGLDLAAVGRRPANAGGRGGAERPVVRPAGLDADAARGDAGRCTAWPGTSRCG